MVIDMFVAEQKDIRCRAVTLTGLNKAKIKT